MGCDTCGADGELKDLSHITPAYRRALWIVVLLNVGYGLAEIIAASSRGRRPSKLMPWTSSAMA